MMDESYILNEKPSIKLHVKFKGQEGDLHLCSRYGCYDHHSGIKVPHDEIIDAFCPHCGVLLNTSVPCEACGAPMITFGIKSGGRVSLCSRHGCNKHYVSFQDLDTAIRKFHEEFGGY
jgi:hypothetical protein